MCSNPCAQLLESIGTYSFDGRERVVLEGESNGQNVLVAVDERVGNRSDGWVADRERDACNGGDLAHESLDQHFIGDVEDGSIKDIALVVDGADGHSVREWRDVEHVEQGGFRGTYFAAGRNDLDVVDDFNCSTGNLGGDSKGLEEGCFAWLHAGVSGGDGDVDGGEGASLGGGLHAVVEDQGADLLHVAVCKDEANVSDDGGQQLLVLGVVVHAVAQGAAHHGVLAHQNDSVAAHCFADLVHLVGADIVDRHDEHGLVLVQQRVELGKVLLLLEARVSL